MSRFKRYERYKDSGVEWIGEIPEEWDVLKLKWIFKLVYRYPTYYGIQYSDNGVIEVRGEMLKGNGLIDVESCEPRFISEEISNNYPMTKLKKDDIVMSVRGTMGKIGLVTDNIENANITANLLRLSPNKDKVYSKWLVWLMESSRFNEELDNYSDQTTIKTIRVPNLLSINIPLPKYDEQNAIANFLDQKTAEIDGLIADKEKLIELLQEKRQAVITEAVTKGLNPNVKMKDSGIEWIGEIPEHWEVKKIKYVSSMISKGTTPSTIGQQILDSGKIRFLKAENIKENKISLIPECYIDEQTHALLRRSQLQENDVLFVIAGATIGKVAVLNKDFLPANTNQAVSFIRLNKLCLSSYCWYWLQTDVINKYVMLMAVQSAQPNLSMEDLGNLPIPCPSMSEQKGIINYLDSKVMDIDMLIIDISTQINKLKEYRQSLISEAVTGKIDVRDCTDK